MSGFNSDPVMTIISGPGADDGFTEEEAYAFLAGLDDPSSTAVMPMVAAADGADDEQTGAMIALVPSEADIARLVLEDGEAAEELHLTLLYLGEAADISENTQNTIIETVKTYAEELDSVVNANAFSINLFNPTGSNSCIVMGIGNDEGGLRELHANLTSAVGGLAGLKMPAQHTPWIPHITLAYTDELEKALELGDRVGPITFDRIRVAFAGEVHDIPLGEPITAAFWNSKDHPRDSDGKFRDKNAVSSSAATPERFSSAKHGRSLRSAVPQDVNTQRVSPSSELGEIVGGFMSGAFKLINDGLRAVKGKASKVQGAPGATDTQVLGTANVRKIIAGMDKLMTSSKTTEDVVTTRGIVDPRKVFGDLWDDDVTGLHWTEHAFSSTSPDADYARSYATGGESVMMNILVPKGTKAIYVEEVLSGATHHELVLDRGIRYRVVRDQGNVSGVRTLDVEVY